MLKSYLFLAVAIICETIGTSALKRTEQFTKVLPTLICLIAFGFSLYFLSFALKEIPIGVAYAIWSAVGIVLISLVGFMVYQQRLDLPAILGISFIVIGVVIIRLFSTASVQ